jgi:thioredoxin reductase (NADPH)
MPSYSVDDTESTKSKPSQLYDVVVIGSGPAGYTAGIYTSRAKLRTRIITGTLPGGQLMTTSEVENYPGFPNGIFGPELMMNMRQQAERFGSLIADDEVIHVDLSRRPFEIASHSETCEAHSVIICTGASPRKLGIRAEEQFAGRGVSYCATCDGPFFKGENIVVVGGGDTALEEAAFLTKFGRSVRVVHRRDSLRVGAVIVKNVDNSGEQKLPAGGLFVAIGHEPNTAIFKGQIELDDKGYIVLKNHTVTSVDGVFAAGDVHDFRYRQAITAGGFGCMAALDVEKWLTERKHRQ